MELTCTFEAWWRYNIALMGCCFDTAEVRTDFISVTDTIAAVGTNLSACPPDYPTTRKTVLVSAPCDHLTLYVYIIPHTLPANRAVDAGQPFEVNLRIFYGEQLLRTEIIPVNQWSGTSAELHLSK